MDWSVLVQHALLRCATPWLSSFEQSAHALHAYALHAHKVAVYRPLYLLYRLHVPQEPDMEILVNLLEAGEPAAVTGAACWLAGALGGCVLLHLRVVCVPLPPTDTLSGGLTQCVPFSPCPR